MNSIGETCYSGLEKLKARGAAGDLQAFKQTILEQEHYEIDR
jgi:hypothetical protein